MITTFFPVNAIMPAKLIAKNVFPSPDMVLLIAMIFEFDSLLINCRLVLSALKDSVTMDFGLLSTIS